MKFPRHLNSHPNSETEVYAVVGHPVRHSRSPHLFNQIFHHLKMNRIYLAFDHPEVNSLVQAMKTLNFKGYSVTIPHKEFFFKLAEQKDLLAQELKCINTVVNKDGILHGYNTDGLGAITAIENQEQQINLTIGSWKQKKITFLGSGGAARGIALTMAMYHHTNGIDHSNSSSSSAFTGTMEFISRNQEKTKRLIDDLERLNVKAKFTSWDSLSEKVGTTEELETDLIINTTPIGMNQKNNTSTTHFSEYNPHSPLQEKKISSKAIVFDIVYTPLKTPLLALAEKRGASVIDGLDMFLAQANYQLMLWTGEKVDMELLRFFFFNPQQPWKQRDDHS